MNNAKVISENENEDFKLDLKTQKKVRNKLEQIINKYNQILLYDYGYLYSSQIFVNFFNKYSKNLVVNCQSNSFNFGFNIPDKYKKANILSVDEAEFRFLVKDSTSDLKNFIFKNKFKFKNYKHVIITRENWLLFDQLSENKSIPTIINQKLDAMMSDIF